MPQKQESSFKIDRPSSCVTMIPIANDEISDSREACDDSASFCSSGCEALTFTDSVELARERCTGTCRDPSSQYDSTDEVDRMGYDDFDDDMLSDDEFSSPLNDTFGSCREPAEPEQERGSISLPVERRRDHDAMIATKQVEINDFKTKVNSRGHMSMPYESIPSTILLRNGTMRSLTSRHFYSLHG
eukprot:scaffold713_cov131-Cylindrotheca_fusiformis.AAC.34